MGDKVKKFNSKTLEFILGISEEESKALIKESVDLYKLYVSSVEDMNAPSMIIGNDENGIFFNLNFLILILTNYGA